MTRVFNKKELKKRRRELRHNMTNAESLLWSQIRNKQIEGQRFLRQYSVEKYVLDFYCPIKKLAIEVDGVTHSTKEEKENDKIRQEAIEQLNIRFLRFTNNEVFNDLEKVVMRIKEKISLF